MTCEERRGVQKIRTRVREGHLARGWKDIAPPPKGLPGYENYRKQAVQVQKLMNLIDRTRDDALRTIALGMMDYT